MITHEDNFVKEEEEKEEEKEEPETSQSVFQMVIENLKPPIKSKSSKLK